MGFTAQFCARYFDRFDRAMSEPTSLVATGAVNENGYLIQARTGAIPTIAFAPFLRAYAPYKSVPNVRLFVRQARRFRRFLRDTSALRDLTEYGLALGQCLANIAYAQLIAENARLLDVPTAMVSTIFHLLVSDFSAAALATVVTIPIAGQAVDRLGPRKPLLLLLGVLAGGTLLAGLAPSMPVLVAGLFGLFNGTT
jgi:hypothetical protein